jgi:hypothetical protein
MTKLREQMSSLLQRLSDCEEQKRAMRLEYVIHSIEEVVILSLGLVNETPRQSNLRVA